jgi:hypothetical protein
MANPAQDAAEKCDFCGKTIPSDHRHFVDLATMQFRCACDMCALVQAEAGTFTPLPQRYFHLTEFNMSDELWSDFLIPVNMAFFVNNSAVGGVVAFYPAPAGATESKLKLEPWNELEQLNPVLKHMAPDLEALLINRLDETAQYFIVPIDSCYKLIGMIRMSWQGLHGGKEVNDTIRRFFEELKSKTNAGSEI